MCVCAAYRAANLYEFVTFYPNEIHLVDFTHLIGPKIIMASGSFTGGGPNASHSPSAYDTDSDAHTDEGVDDTVAPILQLCFSTGARSADATASGFDEVLFGPRAALLVGVQHSIGVVDANNYAVVGHVDLRAAGDPVCVRVAGGFQFMQNRRRTGPDPRVCVPLVFTALVAGAFDRMVDARVLRIAMPNTAGGLVHGVNDASEHSSISLATSSSGVVLTMLSTTPLEEISPLRAEMKLAPTSATTRGGAHGGKKLAKASTNAPVTFGRRIKSSGYGPSTDAPRKMFQPKTAFGTPRSASGSKDLSVDPSRFTTKPQSTPSRRDVARKGGDDVARAYPMDAPPPSVCTNTVSLATAPAHATSSIPIGSAAHSNATKRAISLLGMASHGRTLVAAQTDATVTVVKMPGVGAST